MKHLATRLDLFRDLPAGAIGAEIGVRRGYFSSEILSLPNIGKLYMVDSWRRRDGDYALDPCNAEDHEANMRESQANARGHRSRAEVVQAEAIEWICKQPRGSLDFIYLDADHTQDAAYSQLIASAWPVRSGGYIMGHDYRTCPQSIRLGFGVVEAVTRFCSASGAEIEALALDEWPSYRIKNL